MSRSLNPTGTQKETGRCILLAPDVVNDTLGSLLKYQDDIARIRGSEAAGIIEQLRHEMQTAGAA